MCQSVLRDTAQRASERTQTGCAAASPGTIELLDDLLGLAVIEGSYEVSAPVLFSSSEGNTTTQLVELAITGHFAYYSCS